MIASGGSGVEPTLPGDPDVVDDLVGRLRGYADDAGTAAGALGQLDSRHWTGLAAERFAAAAQHVPSHLNRTQTAFTAAHGVLRDYSSVLRESHASARYATELRGSAAAATAAWKADGSVGPDPGADDRERAGVLLRQAEERMHTAATSAAAHLRQIAGDAPPAGSQIVPGRTPAVHVDGATIHVASAHPLHDPANLTGGAGSHTIGLRYGAAQHVGFADGTNGSTSWESWAAAGESRGVGQVTIEMLAALGLGVLGVAAARRRRARSGRTAFAAAGVDPAALAAARPVRSGAIGGIPARIRSGRAWRTNLAHPPTTPRSWSAPVQLSGQAADNPVVVEVSSAVRHNGPPTR